MNKKSKLVSLLFLTTLISISCSCTHEPTVENRLYVRGAGDDYATVPTVGYIYPFYPVYMFNPYGFGGYSSYAHHVGYPCGYVGSYSYHHTTVIHTRSGQTYRPNSNTTYRSSNRSSSGYTTSSSTRNSPSVRSGFGGSSRGSSSS